MTVTVPWLLECQAEERPEQVAVESTNGDNICFAALNLESTVLARRLVADGLELGEPVGLCFSNTNAVDYVLSYFAVQKAGGVVVPLNPKAPEAETSALLKHAKAHRVLDVDSFTRPLLVEAEAAIVTLPELAEDSPAEIIYTSGTTGSPKGVAVCHRSAAGDLAGGKTGGGKVFLSPVPVHTFAGNSFIVSCAKYGMTNRVMTCFDVDSFIQELHREDVFSVYAVASMWMQLFQDEARYQVQQFTHIRTVCSGASAMPAWGVTHLGEAFPRAAVVNVYGLTEAGAAGCRMRPGDHLKRPGTVGRPLGSSEARIVDEAGVSCATGNKGEILLRNTAVPPRRYHNDDGASSSVWDAEGWVRTGDIGYMDEDGYLYVVDRKKDLVIQGGNNVSPAEVEGVLVQHEQVAEAAVIGLPHPLLGEQVVAVIVPHAGLMPTSTGVQSFVAGRLASYKIPKVIHIAQELPRNAMGKVQKQQLKTAYGEQPGDRSSHDKSGNVSAL